MGPTTGNEIIVMRYPRSKKRKQSDNGSHPSYETGTITELRSRGLSKKEKKKKSKTGQTAHKTKGEKHRATHVSTTRNEHAKKGDVT